MKGMRSSKLRCRGIRRAVLCLAAIVAMALPARALERVRIGVGFGLAFLPAYICEDLKLIEKFAQQQHVDVRVNYERQLGAGPMAEAMNSSAIDIMPLGLAPLLSAWEKSRGTPRQIMAVSGMTTLPLSLLTNQANLHGVADLHAGDRIAIPTHSSPQMFFLQMQSEKAFAQFDRLDRQIVVLPHALALQSLLSGDGGVTAYFGSPPFAEIALKDGKIHRILSSEDVIDGKASFLVLAATSSYIGAHTKLPQAIERAMDEAARLIRDDPHRAARIYLAHEPSKALDAAAIAAVLRQDKDEFGSAIYGVDAFADFLGRHGELKQPPRSWKQIVAPALLNSPST